MYNFHLPEEAQEVHNTTIPNQSNGLVRLEIIGQNNLSHVNCTGDDVGWNFAGITTVYIWNVTFTGCAALRPSTTLNKSSDNMTYNFKVALYFSYSTTIQMTNVTVYTPPGVTAVVMYNPSTVAVEESSFVGSANRATDSSFQGGGGLVLELSACAPGVAAENCVPVTIDPMNILADSPTYKFSGCIFANNSALSSIDIDDNSFQPMMAPVMGWKYNSFGKGGGLSIIVKNKVTSRSFVIDHCRFDGNFAKFHGGGLFVSFLNSTQGNSIRVENSEFLGNSCPFSSSSVASSGGAVHLESYYDQLLGVNGILSLVSNTFQENTAYAGGALFLTSFLKWEGCNACVIHVTNFTNNTAKFGSAIHIQKLRTGQVMVSYCPLILEECIFSGNRIIQDSKENAITESGLGAVYSNQINVHFISSVLFESNEGSALAMVNAVANFSSTKATFCRNTLATRGGAIALFGSSYLLVGHMSNMIFESNSALYQGGAIYNHNIEPFSRPQYVDCFVKYDSPTPLGLKSLPASWHFKNNVIQFGDKSNNRNAIHSTSVEPCIRVHGEAPLCWDGWEYDTFKCVDNRNVSEQYITTSANSRLSFRHSDMKVSAIPGWPIPTTTLGLILHDDLNHTVVSKEVYLTSSDNIPLSVVALGNVSIGGPPNTQAPLHLESLGDNLVRINLTVSFTECPPGFVANEKKLKCVCPNPLASVLKCNDTRKTAVLVGTHWIGMIENDYAFAPCPLHLCQVSNNFVILPYKSSELSSRICNRHRTGVMCGECEEGHCLSVNSWSYECIGYKNATPIAAPVFKYISAVYLPYASFLLIIAAFHLKLSKGSLNGLVLFAQMITTTFDITQHDSLPLTKSSHYFPKTYRFLYGAFNLNFIERYVQNFCFTSDFNVLQVLLLNYLLLVVPVLVVCIAVGIVKVSRCCTKKRNFEAENVDKKWVNTYSVYFIGLSKTLKENIILLCSTVVLLSYTKLCTSTAQILHVMKLKFVNGSTFHDTRVFIAGHVSTDSSYVTYQILAVLCGIYLTTLVLLFLDYPLRLVQFLASKVLILRAVFPSAFISNFAYEFQCYFKPKFRWFAGIYFIFRILASFVYFSGHSSIDRYVTLEVSCIIMALLVMVCKPYEQNSHNLIDILIFASLAAINALNFYQDSYFQLTTRKRASSFVFGIQYVLSMIPIVCFLFCCCMKLAIRSRAIRQQLQSLLLKVPNDRVKLLNSMLTPDPPPNYNELSGEIVCETAEQESNGQGEVTKTGAVPNTTSDVPVTIVGVNDKKMGEATTCQTTLAEGHYLKSAWSFDRNYGAASKPLK